MSRSGYTDDDCEGYHALWRGQVASAIRGKRGQAFLRELVDALDAMPEKKLIAEALQEQGGAVCALGAVGAKRGLDMKPLDPEDFKKLGKVFNLAHQLVCEVEYVNDEMGPYKQTPEDILIGRLTCSCGWRHWLTPEESERQQELQRQAEEAFEAAMIDAATPNQRKG